MRGVNRRLVAAGLFGIGILLAGLTGGPASGQQAPAGQQALGQVLPGQQALGQLSPGQQSAPAGQLPPPAIAPAAPAAQPETIVVFGDSQAQGIAGGLQRVLIEDPRFRILNRTHPGAALVHGESEWLAPIKQFVAHDHADVAVVMVGANDRLDMREDGQYLHFRSEEWREAYARRVDEMLDALKSAGLRILWCGNPIARSGTYSADMEYINQIYAEETARYGAQFLPLWTAVADDRGRYTAYGKDRDGVTQRLRNDDGIHFTSAGYALIADKIVAGLPAIDP